MQVMGFERILGGVCAPQGFLASGVSCGIKENGHADLALVYSETPAAAAGVFTTNQLKAAPVMVTRDRVSSGAARVVVVSSGNANAMTGDRGLEDALRMANKAEESIGLAPGEALVASTGIIGEYLPMDKVAEGIELGASELSAGGNTDAAKAIMTTDTYPKELAVEMEIGGRTVRLGAMAKGSGMIGPHLATMIVILTTDMSIEASLLRGWLAKAVEWSFNRISVDGDQSTNDTVLILANGAAFPEGYEMNEEEGSKYFGALCWVTANLAMALVKDGEGATKLLRVVVNGAQGDSDAVKIAKAVANSHLVKCAVHGGMPNWGRIAAAAGSAGVPLDPDRIDIFLGEHLVAASGVAAPFDSNELEEILGREEVEITLELGLGEGSAYFLTSDLSPEYVTLNASEKS